MGVNFFKWLRGSNKQVEIQCSELAAATIEFAVRDMAFSACKNLIANAIGRCEFRTYRSGKEVHGREYYLWNVEPNANQNASAFIHKLISNLLESNEALVIPLPQKDGSEKLVVADAYAPPENRPATENIYEDVLVNGAPCYGPFRERDVLHFMLHAESVKPVINALYGSYWRMAQAAMDAYAWENGQHWKVHVSKMASGTDDYAQKFAEMIQEQFRPFLASGNTVLPEFDGYTYEPVSKKNQTNKPEEIRGMVEDIFSWTARCLHIPVVLLTGKVEDTGDATSRFMSDCIDPICDQLQEEINRKRYGFEAWTKGDYMTVDSSSIRHFDMFANAANVEKLVGSGAFCVNDVLRAAGLPEINEPWAYKHYLTKNIADIQDAARLLDGGKED